jgi:hypothetical protein
MLLRSCPNFTHDFWGILGPWLHDVLRIAVSPHVVPLKVLLAVKRWNGALSMAFSTAFSTAKSLQYSTLQDKVEV